MRHVTRTIALGLLLLWPGLVRADSATDDLRTFMQKRAALAPADSAGRVNLARWCRGKEMLSQMADLCGEALALDAGNKAAYDMLREYDAGHSMPVEAEHELALEKEFKDRFGRDFKIKNTRHFMILYDTTDQFAAARGAQLEQAYDMFYIYFDMQDLRPSFLKQRLVAVAFKEYDDYSKYAKQVDGQEVPWAAGYYSGRTNRTAFYDDATGPSGAKTQKAVAEMRAQVEELTKEIAENQKKNALAVANDQIRQRNDLNSQILGITRNSDVVMEHFNIIKTLHEATHQMAFNTGIQNRAINYPLWLSEGIATGFEFDGPGGTRGPGVVNLLRMETVKEALKGGKFLPLKDFLTATPTTFDNAGAALFYAQAWSLFHFLYRSDRAGMEKYLQAYLAQKPGVRLGAQQQMKLFTDAFGEDVPGLEERWRKYLQGL